MSTSRGMGPSLLLNLREQHQEADGRELCANPAFTAAQWVGAGYAWDPGGWTVVSPDTAASHIEPGPTGSGVRLVSDGSTQLSQIICAVGRTYQGVIIVSAVAAGNFTLTGIANYVAIAAPGTYRFTFVADAVTITLKRGVNCDVTIDLVSVQEVLQVTWDDSSYQSDVAFLASNRGGAQECLSIVKLEHVDRHTGVVTTAADFSASPGAGAVYTLPTGWTYSCASGSRTTQTSASTLVTSIAANQAPAKSVTGAAGSFGVSLESARTNASRNSGSWDGGIVGWNLGSMARLGAVSGPDGGGATAKRFTGAADGQLSDYGVDPAAAGSNISFWGMLNASTGGASSNFRDVTDVIVSPAPTTAAWARYDAYKALAQTVVAYVVQVGAGTVDVSCFGLQNELGKYPSSYIPTALVAVTRSAATLTVPQDDCNTHSGRIPRITIRPHFAYNETALDCTVIDDSRGILFFEQSTQKFVFEVRGKGRIASLACTFSRDQEIVLRADIDEATSLMTLIVSGATTGNGTYQTYAAPKRKVVCGDGFTAASFPTMLGAGSGLRHGMRFDGGDYLDAGKCIADYLNDFTIWVCVQGWINRLITRRVGATMQWDWYLSPANGLQYLSNGLVTPAGSADLRYVVHTIAVVFTAVGGGTVAFYKDGLLEGASSGVPLSRVVSSTVIGANAGGVNPGSGNMLNAAIYPVALTTQQLAILHAAAMKDFSV